MEAEAEAKKSTACTSLVSRDVEAVDFYAASTASASSSIL